MEISILRDFEELEGLNENENLGISNQNDGDDADDPNDKPYNVNQMQAGDILYELEKRGMKPTGFPDTDKDMLQKEFDKEFEANREEMRIKRKEAKRRAALQAGLQKRREKMENTLQEEQDELAANRQIGMVIEMVKENMADTSLRLDVNSIAARVLAKAMWANNTITCLDLSSNGLNDHAGGYLARILKRNSTLKKIELDNNSLGVKTCIAFGESLRVNDSLVYLSLDSNPLCTGNNGPDDHSGIQALSDSLAENKTLTSLNLWRTQISAKGGVVLANAMQSNSTILFCEVGHNLIALSEVKRIADRLDSNMADFEAFERRRRRSLVTEAQERADLENKESEERKKKELEEWLQSRREQRAEDKRLSEESKITAAQEAALEVARLAAQAKAAAAAKEAEENAKKGAKGKAKKK